MTLLATPDTEAATSLTQLAGEPSVTPAGPERTLPVPVPPALPYRGLLRRTAVTGWALARITALLLARLVGWFAADRRRRRTAMAGLATATAVGLAIGLAVGAVLSLAWEVVRGIVVDELVGT